MYTEIVYRCRDGGTNMGSYDPVYDVEDIQEGAIDGGFIALATVISFLGVIVLFAVFNWGWKRIQKAR